MIRKIYFETTYRNKLVATLRAEIQEGGVALIHNDVFRFNKGIYKVLKKEWEVIKDTLVLFGVHTVVCCYLPEDEDDLRSTEHYYKMFGFKYFCSKNGYYLFKGEV